MARIAEAIGRWRSGRLSCLEAAEVLGMSERHFRRLRERYEADGAEGMIDRRRGRVSGRPVATDRIEWVLEQYRTRYFDFTVKHFHERLVSEHEFELGYTWTKRVLQTAGLVPRAARRSAHCKKRPRRPLPGMLLSGLPSGRQSRTRGTARPTPGSTGRPPLDLIVTMDDATSEIYSAFLVAEEGTHSSLRGLGEVIGRRGLFSSLYSDRGSHYFVTPKAGQKVSKAQRTQVGRALEQLGIEHIAAYSPEARGRMERVFGTLQGASGVPLPACAAGAARGRDDLDRGRQPLFGRALRARAQRALCGRGGRGGERVRGVRGCSGRDPVRAGSAWSATATACATAGCACRSRRSATATKVKMRVHSHADGRLALFHGPRCLARYAACGQLIEVAESSRSAA